MEEVWKSIKGYEGFYEVSNLGRVKSFKGVNERILKTCISNGYEKVNLSKDCKPKSFRIYILLAIAFLNHNPNGYSIIVDHIDNNKLNNNLENLQLITSRENSSKDRKGFTSKYTGVSWCKTGSKWRSSICINGVKKSLGSFINELEASNAYQTALKGL